MCIRDRSKLNQDDTVVTINGTDLSIGDSITVAGGGSGGHTIQNEGTDLAAQDNLNVQDGVEAVDDADNNATILRIPDNYNLTCAKNIYDEAGSWDFTGGDAATDIVNDGDWAYSTSDGVHTFFFDNDDEDGNAYFTQDNVDLLLGNIIRLTIDDEDYCYSIDWSLYSSTGYSSIRVSFIRLTSTQTDILLTTPDDDGDYDTDIAFCGGLPFRAFLGAGASTFGSTGLVPAPSAGQGDAVLKGNRAWGKIATDNVQDDAITFPKVKVATHADNVITSADSNGLAVKLRNTGTLLILDLPEAQASSLRRRRSVLSLIHISEPTRPY